MPLLLRRMRTMLLIFYAVAMATAAAVCLKTIWNQKKVYAVRIKSATFPIIHPLETLRARESGAKKEEQRGEPSREKEIEFIVFTLQFYLVSFSFRLNRRRIGGRSTHARPSI